MAEPVLVKSGPHAGKWVEVVGTDRQGRPIVRQVPAPVGQPVDDGMISTAMQFLTDLGMSAGERALKRTGQLAVGAGQLVAPVLRQIPGVREHVATPEEFQQVLDLLEPPEPSVVSQPSAGEELGGAIGGVIPDLAMILGTGPAISGARTTAAKGVTSLLGTGTAGKAASLAAESGIEGLMGAIEGQIAGGDPALSGGLAASMPMIGAGVRASGIGPRLHRAAGIDVQQSLRPTRKLGRRAENISDEFVERSARGEIPLRGNERLRDFVTGRAEQAGEAVDEFAERVLPTRPPQYVTSALKSIDDVITKETESVNRLTGQITVGDPVFRRALVGVRKQIADLGPVVDQKGILNLRRQLDTAAKRAGGFDRASVIESVRARAQREGADALRRILNEANPDLAQMNREFSFWKSVEDILTESHRSRVGSQGGLYSAGIGGMLGGALAAAQGESREIVGRGTRIFIGAALGRRLVLALRSPLWQRVTSRAKERLARALFSEDAQAVELALGRIFAVEFPRIEGAKTSPRRETRERELASRAQQ